MGWLLRLVKHEKHIENSKNIKKLMITLLQHIAEMSTAAKLLSPFVAEHTNGRAYATVLRLSIVVCRLSATYVLWLNGAS